MKDSVENAPFLSRMLAEQDMPIPIGQNNLTNDADLKVENAEAPENAEETVFALDMFTSNGEEETFTKTKDKRIGYARKAYQAPRIVDVTFEKAEGELRIIFDNGDVMPVGNFPTQSSLGVGPNGERGPKGKDGKNGRTGRDGKKGQTGCEGLMGPTGPQGPQGPDGKDGQRGETGSIGCEGVPGRLGPVGPMGRIGDDGPTGPMHPSCFAEAGPEGPAGRDAETNVYIGSSQPDQNFSVWAQPG